MTPRPRVSRIGETYSSLKVVGIDEQRNYVVCECACGSKNIRVQVSKLLNQTTQSCGCLRKAVAATRNFSHGMTDSDEFSVWKNMLSRCLNPNTDGYERYGGRGIRVCERWMKFENFYADMGNRPNGMTIDRKNNDLGYSPENCRWADKKTQVRNRRCTVVLEFNGISKPLAEWAEILGISYHTLRNKLRRGRALESFFAINQ